MDWYQLRSWNSSCNQARETLARVAKDDSQLSSLLIILLWPLFKIWTVSSAHLDIYLKPGQIYEAFWPRQTIMVYFQEDFSYGMELTDLQGGVEKVPHSIFCLSRSEDKLYLYDLTTNKKYQTASFCSFLNSSCLLCRAAQWIVF